MTYRFLSVLAAVVAPLCAETVELAVNSVKMFGITHLEIEGKCLDVALQGTNQDTLSMGAVRLSEGLMVKSKRERTTLRVWVESPVPLFSSGCQGTLTLAVPSGLGIKVENISGDISIDDISARSIVLKAVSGSIDMQNCSSPTRLKTVSGEVDVDSLEGDLTVESVSGEIDIAAANGFLSITSVSGEQDVDRSRGAIEAKSVSGSVEFNDFEGRISVESISGSIEGERVNATGECRFKTTSGSITLGFTSIDDLVFDLESTSGTLEVGSDRNTKRLKAGKGTIPVRGVSGSGSQKFF